MFTLRAISISVVSIFYVYLLVHFVLPLNPVSYEYFDSNAAPFSVGSVILFFTLNATRASAGSLTQSFIQYNRCVSKTLFKPVRPG